MRWVGRISYSLYLWQEMFLLQESTHGAAAGLAAEISVVYWGDVRGGGGELLSGGAAAGESGHWVTVEKAR